MKERSIEDEIDFTIVRGQREGLVVKKQEDAQTGNTGGVFARAAKRFQRQ
jgi:hypothetical protein